MGQTVVHISQNLPPVIGGGETYANRLVYALRKRGFNVVRIGEYRNDPDLHANTDDTTISVPGFNESVFSSKNFLGISQVLSELLVDIKPDLIHTHNFFSGVLGLLSAPSSASLVHTEHHTPYWSTLHEKHTLADLHDKLFPSFFSSPRLSAVVASSNYFLEYLKPFIHNGCLQETVYPIIPQAFADAVTKKEAAKRLGLDAAKYLDSFIILCPSRLTPRKKIENLFYALSQMRLANWICIISAGKEAPIIKYRTYLEELAIRLNISTRIVCDLRISDERMPLLYQLADLVTLPSAEEGLGIAALESMQSGTPFIGNANKGFREALRMACSDDYLIDCEDSALYAHTMANCLTTKKTLEQISEVQASIGRLCSEDFVAEKVIGIYQRVLESRILDHNESQDITSRVISYSGSSFFLERANDQLIIRKSNVSKNEILWTKALYCSFAKHAVKAFSLKIAKIYDIRPHELLLECASGLSLRNLRNINHTPILSSECFSLVVKSVDELYQIIKLALSEQKTSECDLLFEEQIKLFTLGDWIDYHGLLDPVEGLHPIPCIKDSLHIALSPLIITHGTINLDHVIVDRLTYVTIIDYGNHIGMRPCTYDLMNLIREELRFPVGKQNSWIADDWVEYINHFLECAHSLSFFDEMYSMDDLLINGYICLIFLIRRNLIRMGIGSGLSKDGEPNRIADVHRWLYDKILSLINEKITYTGT